MELGFDVIKFIGLPDNFLGIEGENWSEIMLDAKLNILGEGEFILTEFS